ncbi:MAG: HEAT repeat domain-containing protein [Anaerolineaceae bacterium]|nr:HEAT repeat domain-containing protein [Anaerolineaceae bacterium]
MVDELTSFIDMMAELDLDAYILPEPHGETVRALRRLRRYVGDNEALIKEVQNLEQPDTVRIFALGQIKAAEANDVQVAILGSYLFKDRSPSVRIAIAKLLQESSRSESIDLLLQALIASSDLHFRGIVAESIRNNETETWEEKAKKLLLFLQGSGRFREYVDIVALVTAVTPPAAAIQPPGNRFFLTDKFIACAPEYADDPRMVGILAALIVESCGHNLKQAVQRIDRYISSHTDNKEKISPLRNEINSLLTPIEWHETLEKTYHAPMGELQKDVRMKWLSSVLNAQVGLYFRLVIGFLVSVSGVLLIIFGAYNLLDVDLWLQSLIQIGLGLFLLFLTLVHRDPLRDTQQTLAEIRVANTVYAAFSQQRIDISHQHSALTLQNRLTMADVKESSLILGQAMKDAVQTLRNDRNSTSLDDFLAQFD